MLFTPAGLAGFISGVIMQDEIIVAVSGKFSGERSIAEYAAQIWDAKPCPVQEGNP